MPPPAPEEEALDPEPAAAAAGDAAAHLAPPPGAPAPGGVDGVGYTCRITAAFRAVELAHNSGAAIIRDPLAEHLAGAAAVEQARRDHEALVAAQGPGRCLRVPARNRIVDDALAALLEQAAAREGAGARVQVVNVGCGMDSKPWRLAPPCRVAWFDLDQPAVMALKQRLLQQAGAALLPAQPCAAAGGAPASRFPLLVDSWRPVAADLAATPLAKCLAGAGFEPGGSTVWIAEALLYYLPLPSARELLASMHALSGAGSKLVATVIDADLQEAHRRLPQPHYFSTANVAWHFSERDLLGEGAGGGEGESALGASGWQLDMQPQSTARLAERLYGRSVYTALYGGAESCFTADPRPAG